VESVLDVIAVVAPAPAGEPHVSPVSGARGAFFHVEVLEDEQVIGVVLFGDLVRLAYADRVVDVLVRDIIVGFPDTRPPPQPLPDPLPPELLPLVLRASGRGVLGFREHVVRDGDRLRLRGAVEAHASRDVVLVARARLRLDLVLSD